MNMKEPDKMAENLAPEVSVPTASSYEMDNAKNVDKIRDIIFGGQMREYANRFEAIEGRLIKENTRLRQDMEQRLTSLEVLVQREFETLADKLRLEKIERNNSLSSIEASLKKADDLLNQRLVDLENKSIDEMRKLRSQEHDDIKNLRDSLHQLREETNAHFEKELEILRKTKVDRASVASLFVGSGL